ncbi:MAG: hypothetical protein KKA70_05675 [Proteobacteria bacterium]|nr:hypothetical protein [Pseudomonadota bacterium]
MDIIIGDYEFFLPKIPYEVVYDTKAQSDFPDETFVVKKCGVRFGKLTTGQTRKLEHFIESNAAVEMEFSLSA